MALGRILLVDDSQTVLLSLEEHLRYRGYETETAATLRAGMEAVASRRPDVVVSDLILDDGSGLDLIRRVRESFGAEARPGLILLTGFASLESAIEAIHAGADEYLLKPVELRELDAVVDALVSRHTLEGKADHGPAAEILGRIATPLALLGAHLEMLAEGRFGPLTQSQEAKLTQARDSLARVAAEMRGKGAPFRPLPTRRTTERAEVNRLIARIFRNWSEDFERRGVQVSWGQAPGGPPLFLDLAELERESDEFLASCLAKAGLGMTLRLDWQASPDGLAAALLLESLSDPGRSGPGATLTVLAELRFSLGAHAASPS